MESTALLIAATLNAGTVLAIASLGLLINEKAGIVNLGAEGMMLCAALAGFATVVHTGSTVAGFRRRHGRGCLAGRHLRRAGDLAQHQPVRHRAGAVAVRRGLLGLCRHVLCAGKAARAGAASPSRCWATFLSWAMRRCSSTTPWSTLCAADVRLIWFLYRTRAGLVLRSVGESPESAHALGYPVRRIRCWRWWPVARCAVWPGPTCRPCTPRCGWRA
jgi:general nucleoside transport system permease protein